MSSCIEISSKNDVFIVNTQRYSSLMINIIISLYTDIKLHKKMKFSVKDFFSKKD